ncbi:MAG TPA: response regulator transcription factor [Opitutales bacterium]|nr:response regulator transcription factor [Opitutales bacterium]
MKIIVADDQNINRSLLRTLLEAEGHHVIEAQDGDEALAAIRKMDEPFVGLIDWEMPGMEGPEVCRQARAIAHAPPMFLFLVTVRDRKEDIVTGLRAGANDYVTKPFHKEEMIARVRIGVQMAALQQDLLERVRELSEALARVKTLSGLLPICGFCKKIRNDRDYWQQVDDYISNHADVKFSHSVCPECYESILKPQLEEMKRQQKNSRG